eukprot:CAMPEP_0185033760 /NCGR_PEP_ID=MMETSP1103-20130426/23048_1 /TAXON_ID=36769 /ORGANISM="Paraphysomonas bandaiensis, Strain Caron Lab Isolate" /LENGTH=125 /DNA_ID=CAMNT_0027570157 /DNA_START=117 /DNA_END=493 /DNA_ORIENTATION=+
MALAVTIPTSTTAQVSELKRQLIEQWPSVIEQCDDTSRIRFLCMGCGELKDGNTLGPKFPIFADHPTPVNVSIRPAGMGGSKKQAPPVTPAKNSNCAESNLAASPQSASNGGSNSDGNRCCCAIS